MKSIGCVCGKIAGECSDRKDTELLRIQSQHFGVVRIKTLNKNKRAKGSWCFRLIAEFEISAFVFQVDAKPWRQLQEEREALMTKEIEKTKCEAIR